MLTAFNVYLIKQLAECVFVRERESSLNHPGYLQHGILAIDSWNSRIHSDTWNPDWDSLEFNLNACRWADASIIGNTESHLERKKPELFGRVTLFERERDERERMRELQIAHIHCTGVYYRHSSAWYNAQQKPITKIGSPCARFSSSGTLPNNNTWPHLHIASTHVYMCNVSHWPRCMWFFSERIPLAFMMPDGNNEQSPWWFRSAKGKQRVKFII